MDRLWSPWRFRYITQASPRDACIFCAKHSSGNDDESLIAYRGRHNFVLLNLYPYTNGHLMIAPYAHIGALEELPADAASEMMALTQRAVRVLKTAYKPDGLNAGLNLGESAGAGVAGHLHMHVLPRWTGDSNFMTVIGETRVLPEELSETLRKVRDGFAAV